MKFEELKRGIYRLKIPFENIYTSVFALENNGRYIIFDSASGDDDSYNYIIPAIKEMGFYPEYLICSHTHSDHSGGINALSKSFPNASVMAFSDQIKPIGKELYSLTDGEILLDRYKILNLKGHSDDSAGILDIEENILISADCLQLYGITKYGTGVAMPAEYMNTLDRVRALGLNGLITSHEYVPLGSLAFGNESVIKYLDTCADAVRLIVNTIKQNSAASAEELSKIYTSEHKDLPTVNAWVFSNITKAMSDKTFDL